MTENEINEAFQEVRALMMERFADVPFVLCTLLQSDCLILSNINNGENIVKAVEFVYESISEDGLIKVEKSNH